MKRNLQLDFLRFLAIFLVLLHHLPLLSNSVFGRSIAFLNIGGWIGVDLFFVLSGYLVTSLIITEEQKTGSFDAKRFLIRRGFKIYPVYYLFIAYQFIFSAVLTHYPQSTSGLLHESIFTANYLSSNNTHLWSISLEEHFYILLSLLFLFLIRLKKVNLRGVFFIYLVLFLIGLGFRTFNYFHYTDYNFERDFTQSHYRFDSLFFGSLIAYVSIHKLEILVSIRKSPWRYVNIVVCLLLLSTNFIFKREEHRIMAITNLAFNPICFGYLLVLLVDYKNETFLKTIKPLAYIGMYSYSIYLFHIHFLNLCDKFLSKGSFLYYAGYLTLAVIGGIVISKGIEYPILRLREKYYPSKSKALNPQ
ncbi:acyltransferase family protein [Pedobacter sp. MW01-1-1]|uniref:acyltransferase family protein n=1 Tax=Pedobacter sp. MW01-1-1 TaxID=3383027 RepID=UPI003FEFFDA3